MKYFKEVVEESIAGHIVRSRIEEMSEQEVRESIKLFNDGRCEHMPIVDYPGYMYDIRSCALCGKHLGLI